MPTDDYKPIDCGLHSEYELAIMHKAKCELRWRDSENIIQTCISWPVDLIVRQKQEFLLIKIAQGDSMKIRLDKIEQLKPV